uniref:Cytin chain A n=1 Tax=Theromyzon tessulatum TaxID=13286 RepID=CYTA_THETS|nr:RecName: Full=Cytin chain A [Theromyzon tessulatum]
AEVNPPEAFNQDVDTYLKIFRNGRYPLDKMAVICSQTGFKLDK